MKKIFQNLSIKHKLTLIIFVASLTISLLGFGVVLIQERQRLISETIRVAKEEIKMLSQELVKIILYGSVDISADVVSKLETFYLTENSFLFDLDGNIVFSYHKKGIKKIAPPALLRQHTRYEGNHFYIFQPVTYLGKDYGVAYYKVSDSALVKQIKNYYYAIAAIVPFVALCSFLLALWLQRYFTTPILRLTHDVEKITKSHNYSKRISINTQDEFGDLYAKYNQLLGEIEAREKSLFDSEQRLAGIIDIAGSAIISINDSQQIILFNKQAENIFCYSAKDVIGQSIDVLIPEKYQRGHKKNIEKFSTRGSGSISSMGCSDIFAIRKNGEEFPISASISKGEFGGNNIFTVAINDITDIKKKENEIKTYQLHLEDLVAKRTVALEVTNKELESYSYSIAHDLRAPLRSITSFSQILSEELRGRLSVEEKDLMQRVIRASKNMAILIDDILQLSRISRGNLQHKKIDLSKVSKSILLRYQEHEPKRKVKWKVQPGLMASGDPSLLEVMLENLLGNAWKFTSKEPSPEIEFGMNVQEKAKTYFVRDNGLGFDMKYSEKIFGEFQRLHGSGDFEGTGIGLATVKRIVARHGGQVWVEAKEGKGAAFYFTLV